LSEPPEAALLFRWTRYNREQLRPTSDRHVTYQKLSQHRVFFLLLLLFFFFFFSTFLCTAVQLWYGLTCTICGALHFFFLIEPHWLVHVSFSVLSHIVCCKNKEKKSSCGCGHTFFCSAFLQFPLFSFVLLFFNFVLLFHQRSTIYLSSNNTFFLFCWPFPFLLSCTIFLFFYFPTKR
jgi:hypothetical protein